MAYQKRFSGSAKFRIESYKRRKFEPQRKLQEEQRQIHERPFKEAVLKNLCDLFNFSVDAPRESRYALFGVLESPDGSRLQLRLGIGKDIVQIGLSGPAKDLIPLRDAIAGTDGVNFWWESAKSELEKRMRDPMKAPNLVEHITLPGLSMASIGVELKALASKGWKERPGAAARDRMRSGDPLAAPKRSYQGAA